MELPAALLKDLKEEKYTTFVSPSGKIAARECLELFVKDFVEELERKLFLKTLNKVNFQKIMQHLPVWLWEDP